MTPFSVRVVSQDRQLYEGQVLQIVVTADTGELGILANHIPLMATLRPGQVRLLLENNEEQILYVSGGFVEVQPKQTIILADEAERAEEIDEERVRKAKERAEALMQNGSAIEYKQAQIELAQLTAQLAIIRRVRHRS